MTRVPSWRRYLRFWRPNIDADIDDELRFHLEERVDDLRAQGITTGAAHRRAREEFGDVGEVRDGLRSIDRRIQETRRQSEVAATIRAEVRRATRTLARSPGFTLVAIVTLALGIGATTAIYTLLQRIVLDPLPYPSAGRLVKLHSPVPSVAPGEVWGLAKGQYLYVRGHSRTMDAFALYGFDGGVLGAASAAEHRAERLSIAVVSASTHDVLGIRPILGRPIGAADNIPEDGQVALLTHDFWQRQFGGDSAVVGRRIELSGQMVEIVGVLPAGARLPNELRSAETRFAMWMPLWLDPAQPARNNHIFQGIGRLRPGASLEAAQAELAQLTLAFPEAMPTAYSVKFLERSKFSTGAVLLRDDVLGGIGRALWILLAAVALVLVIACANVANLYLVRLDGRRRETAVRVALGASRGQLAWHFLTESLLLAGAGGAAGAALAALATRLLGAIAPAGIPRLEAVHVGWAGAAVAAAVSFGVGTIFGLVPLRRTRVDLLTLRDASRGLTATREQHVARTLLVGGQIALAVVLLAAAGLMVRSARRLAAVPSGVDPRGVLTVEIGLPRERYAPRGDSPFAPVGAFVREVTDRLAAIPGVETVGLTTSLPLVDMDGCYANVVTDGPRREGRDASPCVVTARVTPAFFRALGIPVTGEVPTLADGMTGIGGAIVSRALARRLWPNESPIGKGIRCCFGGPPYHRIVGIAEDVRGAGLDQGATEVVYFPMNMLFAEGLSGPPRGMKAVIRTGGADPLALLPAVRRAIGEIDRDVVVEHPRSMGAVVARSMARTSFTMELLALAGAMALVLCVVGIYGVISYVVGQRRAEIGIRVALGAQASQVSAMVVGQAVRLAAVGVVVGLVAAVAGTRVMRSLLFEVSPTDPVTLGSVAILLVALAALAAAVPARRAAKVDPTEALRTP
jgi:putative ABC transport system permease protein